MATLTHSTSYLFFTCHRLYLSQNQSNYRLSWNPLEHPHRKQFRLTICACSGTKSSRSSSRKVKSNEELRNEIREFLSSVGLPEGHVPSMKELSDHGRSDLANIVRRRGYKLIRELLTRSTKTEFDTFTAEKSLAGQDDKVDKHVEEVSLSVGVPGEGTYFGSTKSDSLLISDDQSCIGIESSANSALKENELYTLNSQNENVNNIVEDISLPTDVLNMTNLPSGASTDEDINSEDSIFPPIESSSNSFLEGTDSLNKGQHGKEEGIAEKVSSSTDVLIMDNYSSSSNLDPSINLDEDGYMPQTTSTTTTLDEEVSNFIQNGDLDMLEDTVNGNLIESDVKESKRVIEGENAVEAITRTPGEYAYGNVVSGAIISHGSSLTSNQIDPTATMNYPLRGDRSAAQRLIGAEYDTNLDVETGERENNLDINHLKYMLHQKELELSRLKEQIEKEKLALSVLQNKAETEISKAQKIVSEKGAELNAAEESLSGLEEVLLQYTGDGEIVEVAGSFNGWHHRIKMDPQPFSSIIEPIGSRKSRLWSTVLWLYPGKYEIKFIVDGQWRIDPQRESVNRGGICNNILLVER